MEYRTLPRSSEKISVIGMGTSAVGEGSPEEIAAVTEKALEYGVNLFDLASGHKAAVEGVGKVIKKHREDVFLQIHFGAEFVTGEYGWTTDLSKIKAAVSWVMEQTGSDYIDFGFIHCMDENSDFEEYKANGVIDYIQQLKADGIVHHLALSSHTPAVANRIMDEVDIDLLMFSINPAYDYKLGEYAHGETDERTDLYRRCEAEGIGISVMKPYCGGQLLDKDQSPFKEALTEPQCLQYALDKPGVVSVLTGFKTIEELDRTMKFFDASEDERDYSILGRLTPEESQGRCVYCKHCHPCPGGLDIALINKYYDLSCLGDPLAKDHYLNLAKTASACISCGHCNFRCPFHVNQNERMIEIKNYFGV